MSGLHGISVAIPLVIVKEYAPQRGTSLGSVRNDAPPTAAPYAYSYLFAYALDVAPGTRTLTLPDNDRIRILAITVAEEPWVITPAHPLYDTLKRNER